MATDLKVVTKNPRALDGIVQQFGAAVKEYHGLAGQYDQVEPDTYLVRCFGDPGFVEFMIEHQGYGHVIGRTLVDPAQQEAPPDEH